VTTATLLATACACGATGHETVLAGRYDRLDLRDFPFTIVRCRACGLARTLDPPDPSQYHDGYVLATGATSDGWSARIAQLVADSVGGGRLVDVGCHVGNLVEAAATLGFDAEGVDIDRAAVAEGRRIGRPVRVASVADLEGPYDALVLNHVLEHIHDLGGFLDDVRRVLAPTGLAFVFVPNYEGLIPRLMGERWMGWSPAQHVWHFTPATLATTAARSGLRVASMSKQRVHEPPSSGTKGVAKAAAARLSSVLGRGDLIEAVLAR
jgi:SAM-dependent methyltransferase